MRTLAPMNETALPTVCTKCGKPLPQEAGFCPTCGSRARQAVASTYTSASATTSLPIPSADSTAGTRLEPADAQTVSPTGLVTSLDSPSPRPVGGGAMFVAGQQVGPRYTIL